jgi:dipeptidyl aminopeptidase/acylaminoacyl peptidase
MGLTLRAAALIVLQLVVYGSADAESRSERADGHVVSDVAYDVPAFENAVGVDYFVDRAGYVAAASDARYALREIRYRSGGLLVPALVYRPCDARGARRPVIVFNRGSYVVERDVGYKLLPMFHRLAEAGFVVVAPMYRASFGTEGKDELGGADLADLMNVAPLVASLPYADARNVFLYGESRGGVMTLMAIRDGFPANAAATFGAFTDLDAYVRSAGLQLEELSRRIWPDFDTHRSDIVRRRSAIYWPEKLRVPLLLMHGGADTSVDPSHARALAEKLRRAGAVYKLEIFDGDNHVLRANQEERDRRAVAWFRRFLR